MRSLIAAALFISLLLVGCNGAERSKHQNFDFFDNNYVLTTKDSVSTSLPDNFLNDTVVMALDNETKFTAKITEEFKKFHFKTATLIFDKHSDFEEVNKWYDRASAKMIDFFNSRYSTNPEISDFKKVDIVLNNIASSAEKLVELEKSPYSKEGIESFMNSWHLKTILFHRLRLSYVQDDEMKKALENEAKAWCSFNNSYISVLEPLSKLDTYKGFIGDAMNLIVRYALLENRVKQLDKEVRLLRGEMLSNSELDVQNGINETADNLIDESVADFDSMLTEEKKLESKKKADFGELTDEFNAKIMELRSAIDVLVEARSKVAELLKDDVKSKAYNNLTVKQIRVFN